MELRKYNVTIRRFNPQNGLESGEDFVLSVDSPDKEHAVASTMSDAISFTTKPEGSLLPLPFAALGLKDDTKDCLKIILSLNNRLKLKLHF